MVTDTQEHKCHNPAMSIHNCLVWALSLVLLYAVSVAPAARLAALSGRASVWLAFMTTYKPVMLLRGTPLRGAFDWWVGLWVDDLKPFNLSAREFQRTNPAASGNGTVSFTFHIGLDLRAVPEP